MVVGQKKGDDREDNREDNRPDNRVDGTTGDRDTLIPLDEGKGL